MIERRFHRSAPKHKIEIRGEGDDRKITGYAAVFYREGDPDTEYWITDDIVERIDRSAFDQVVGRDDVLAVFNHNDDNLLGRSSANTLKLRIDDVGLRYEIRFDENDPDHVRVQSKINRGDLSGSSFAFFDPVSEWNDNVRYAGRDGVSIRNITDVGNLYDVGPVSFPAYKGTSAGMRCGVHSKADANLVLEMRNHHLKQTRENEPASSNAVDVQFRMAEISMMES